MKEIDSLFILYMPAIVYCSLERRPCGGRLRAGRPCCTSGGVDPHRSQPEKVIAILLSAYRVLWRHKTTTSSTMNEIDMILYVPGILGAHFIVGCVRDGFASRLEGEGDSRLRCQHSSTVALFFRSSWDVQ
jgi:hypothetical protein